MEEDKKKTDLEALQEYLGLENIDDARKAKWILDELRVYGNWGDKVSAYFSSILSSIPGTRTFIPEKQIEAFKTLFINLKEED